jgi:DNA-binding response OmpR family regulator
MMPLMDGMEVLRQIRSRRVTSKVPVIMLTAKTASVSVDQARQLWVSDYVMKPFDPEKLVVKVRKALHLPAEP